MKEMLETMPRIELALIIIGVFVLILGIILGYAMIHEYRMYLENHWKARYSFRDFIKRETLLYLSSVGFHFNFPDKPLVFLRVSFGSNETKGFIVVTHFDYQENTPYFYLYDFI